MQSSANGTARGRRWRRVVRHAVFALPARCPASDEGCAQGAMKFDGNADAGRNEGGARAV